MHTTLEISAVGVAFKSLPKNTLRVEAKYERAFDIIVLSSPDVYSSDALTRNDSTGTRSIALYTGASK
jgi:hypothetical protein